MSRDAMLMPRRRRVIRWPTHAWLLVICCAVALPAAKAAQPAGAPHKAPSETVWICAPPKRGPLDPCPKGSKGRGYQPCVERHRGKRKPRPKFRVGYGPTLTVGARKWTCVRWPRSAHPVRAWVFNYGRLYAWLRPKWAGCKSGRVDIVYHEFYGTAYSKCSRRKPPKSSGRMRLVPDYPVVLKRPKRTRRGR